MALPDRTALRTELQTFDDVEKKVVGGMLAVMFGQPAKIRDREWMSEQFTQVALLTGQFEDVEHAHDGVERAQEWIQTKIGKLLSACVALFVHVAEDMRERHGEGEFSASDAMIQALAYFDELPDIEVGGVGRS